MSDSLISAIKKLKCVSKVTQLVTANAKKTQACPHKYLYCSLLCWPNAFKIIISVGVTGSQVSTFTWDESIKGNLRKVPKTLYYNRYRTSLLIKAVINPGLSMWRQYRKLVIQGKKKVGVGSLRIWRKYWERLVKKQGCYWLTHPGTWIIKIQRPWIR